MHFALKNKAITQERSWLLLCSSNYALTLSSALAHSCHNFTFKALRHLHPKHPEEQFKHLVQSS